MDIDQRSAFMATFSGLFPREEWAPDRLEPILASLQYRELDAGTTILREGQSCSSVPFVLEGSIRVYRVAESGREITLYRIESAQSCILSSACGAGIASFPASAVAETKTSAVFMPSDTVRSLLSEGRAFRDYVLEQYSRRMVEVMELVQEIAFRKVDQRLAQALASLGSKAPSGIITATHQELADHVGTSREVVSRILKDWEQRGAVDILRGSLRLLPSFRELRL